MAATPEHVSEMIADQLQRSADRPAWARRSDLNDRLKAFTVPELRGFLAAEGVRFNSNPSRLMVVTEILDTFTPED